MELRPTTTLVPTKFRKPQHIHDHDKLCLSKEAAQHVYHVVQHNEPVTPLYINPHKAAKPSSHVTPKENSLDMHNQPSKATLQPEMESKPHAQALHGNIDYCFGKDPVNKGQPTELLWSLMSTEVTHTSHTTNTTPYSPLYSERLYDCLDLSEINFTEFLMGIVLIGLRKSNQLLKYLLILRRQVMFLPLTWANSAPLVEILSLRIKFLLVAIAPHRGL